MALSPSTISSRRIKKNTKRVGRGNGSGKGTYSARGLKGQRARSGGKRGLLKRAFKAQLQKVPKSRGFRSIAIRPETITLAVLERKAEQGIEITPFYLKQIGLIKKAQNGVKIVASGELKKKLNFKGCLATKKALEIIEKAGGKLVY
ncbi:MAG TPA: 50S ribosomal protein L15 [Candidatus Magasanikbacteria bacterium]|nr:MAG: 50S ribosomal protein L15 [Candidatus Magasanikbacteria bacterium RIFOXYC2_FULL_39_8]HAT03726.1 50S ribosomal protein L15 [Candidatus Magasanikbacteria bacterium]